MTIVYHRHSGLGSDAEVCLSATEFDEAQPYQLEYLNEGNANVIYRIRSPTESEDVPFLLRHKLLRLRKDKPFIQTTKKQHDAYKKHFMPLFHEDNLVEHVPIRLEQETFILLNRALRELEESGHRSNPRYGDTLAIHDQYGLLMTDMTAQEGCLFLELKPKWLAQSPDAPAHAVRCRTCALRARRQAMSLTSGACPDIATFCPLGLVSDNLLERQKVFENVLTKQCRIAQQTVQTSVSVLARGVLPVLKNLQAWQIKLDSEGIVAKEPSRITNDYLKAMTLRDCILLIKGELSHPGAVFDIRIADLDLKQAHLEKVLKWKATECELIDEGWYTNTETDARTESICLLSHA